MSPRVKAGLVRELGRLVRSHLSSATATGLEWCLVTVLLWTGVYYLVAAAAGAILGAIIDFSLKRSWAFRRAERAALHHEALRYLFVSGCSLLLNLCGAYALVDGVRLPSMPGVILASIAVGLLWNYPMQRFFVFRAVRSAMAVMLEPPATERERADASAAAHLDEVVERIARA